MSVIHTGSGVYTPTNAHTKLRLTHTHIYMHAYIEWHTNTKHRHHHKHAQSHRCIQQVHTQKHKHIPANTDTHTEAHRHRDSVTETQDTCAQTPRRVHRVTQTQSQMSTQKQTQEHTQEGSHGDPRTLALQELQTLGDAWNRGPEATPTQMGDCTFHLLCGPKKHLEASLGRPQPFTTLFCKRL